MGLRSYLSLFFSPANRDWQLQSSSPQNLSSLLTHPLTADCAYVACLYFLLWLCHSHLSVVPGSSQKIPSCWHSADLHFFQTRNWLFTSPVMPSILESFGLVILKSGAVSLSRHHPIWAWLRMSSISHILWLRLHLTSSCVEDSLCFCFMFGDKFLIEKWFLLDFQTESIFFLLLSYNRKEEEEGEEEKPLSSHHSYILSMKLIMPVLPAVQCRQGQMKC